jgi:hypothetical protein
MLPNLRLPLALAATLLGGCATFDRGGQETVLPMNRAWVDGKVVEYVTTDVSDAEVAKTYGANHAPRLAKAVGADAGGSVLERVYKFANNEQIGVFQSGPRPTGPANADRSYSPLWRMVLVRWVKPEARRELRSEEAVLAAEERGELTLEITSTVVNCPVTRGVDGVALRGVR